MQVSGRGTGREGRGGGHAQTLGFAAEWMDSFRMTSCGVGGATGWDMSIDGMSVGDGGPIWRTMRVLCVCARCWARWTYGAAELCDPIVTGRRSSDGGRRATSRRDGRVTPRGHASRAPTSSSKPLHTTCRLQPYRSVWTFRAIILSLCADRATSAPSEDPLRAVYACPFSGLSAVACRGAMTIAASRPPSVRPVYVYARRTGHRDVSCAQHATAASTELYSESTSTSPSLISLRPSHPRTVPRVRALVSHNERLPRPFLLPGIHVGDHPRRRNAARAGTNLGQNPWASNETASAGARPIRPAVALHPPVSPSVRPLAHLSFDRLGTNRVEPPD